jgi:protein-disulfide isomerase
VDGEIDLMRQCAPEPGARHRKQATDALREIADLCSACDRMLDARSRGSVSAMAKRKKPTRIVRTTSQPASAGRAPRKLQLQTRTLYLGAIGAALAIAAALVILSVATRGGGGSKPSQPTALTLSGTTATNTLLDGVPQRGNTLGSPSAPVTLVEYADPQCPYCAQWAQGALPELVRDYVRTGRVRIEYRGMAFIGPESSTGLAAALAAGNQNKFWHVVELLYANQGSENSGWINSALLGAIADKVGVDASRFHDERQSSAVAEAVNNSTMQARAAGVNSTPTFYAGRTGGTLRPVDVTSLDAGALRPALDKLLAS